MEFTVPLIWYSKLPGESEPQARVEKKKGCLVAVCLVDRVSYINSPLYTKCYSDVQLQLESN